MLAEGPSESLIRFAEKHDFICHLCQGKVRLDVSSNHPAFPSRDHIFPKSYLKKGMKGHYMLAHGFCNSFRGDKKVSKCRPFIFQDRIQKAIDKYEARQLMVDGKYSTG